ncbi:MAG: VWA-like domain-containing protein [Roseobacter sp.]
MARVRSRRAARALAHLPESDPALAALALWCHFEDGDAPTQTQGHVVLIGPELPLLPLREQIGLVGHHILHISLRHAGRMAGMASREGPGFEKSSFNLAADALINEILGQAKHALPRPAVTLADLHKRLDLGEAKTDLSRWDVETLYLHLKDQGASGRDRVEAYQQDVKFRQDLSAGVASGAKNDREETAQWQGHLARALQAQGAAGRGIGPVMRGLGDLPVSATPWENQLRGLVAKTLQINPRATYRRPRRTWIAAEADAVARKAPNPVFEPAQRHDGAAPRIVIGLDTSGSIKDRQLARLAGEISGIARRVGASLHLLCFDETVYAQHRLDPLTLSQTLLGLDVRRDGGTHFADLIDTAGALDPSILVVLSDMDGEAGRAPRFPVLWAVPQRDPPPPPFGRVISMAG